MDLAPLYRKRASFVKRGKSMRKQKRLNGSNKRKSVAEPLETMLLAQAKGATCVTGYHMRLYQAAEQFRLYAGVEPPLVVMEAALLEASKAR